MDYGEKRIGLALSDPLQIFAKPYKVLPNKSFDALIKDLRQIISENGVGLMVFGIPYAIEGGNTAKTDEVAAVYELLKPALPIPVLTWDERYTTLDAIEELKKLGYDWKRRRKVQDAMAATLILKDYLAQR